MVSLKLILNKNKHRKRFNDPYNSFVIKEFFLFNLFVQGRGGEDGKIGNIIRE